MRRWIEIAASLYPAKWQQRYGTEFRALLEDLHPGWREFFNVLGGALKMQLLTGEALYLKLGAVSAALGMIAAAAFSFTVPRQYIASAIFRTEVSTRPLASAIQILTSRTSLAEIIQQPEIGLYKTERLQEPLEDVIERMRSDLRIKIVRVKESGSAVQIEFRYPDRLKAQAVVNALSVKLSSLLPSSLMIKESPSLPIVPVSTNRVRLIGFGLVLGLALGQIVASYVRQTRRALLITAMGLIGALLGGGFSLSIQDRYISQAVIRIVPADKQGAANAAQRLQQATTEVLSRRSLAELLQRPELNLYAKERSVTPLEDVIEKMRDQDLHLQLLGSGKVPEANSEGVTGMMINFTYQDRFKAQAVVEAIALKFVQSSQDGSIEFLDNASLPQSPSFPNRAVISAVGLASGLLAGAVSLRVLKLGRPNLLENS